MVTKAKLRNDCYENLAQQVASDIGMLAYCVGKKLESSATDWWNQITDELGGSEEAGLAVQNLEHAIRYVLRIADKIDCGF